MKHSMERILTTHVGSLPRPPALAQAMVKRDRGTLSAGEAAALPQQICEAVDGVVRKQAETGLDIINDGEASKIGYATYVRERLSGFEGTSRGLTIWDLDEVPEFAGRALEGLDPVTPACTGPITFQGHAALEEDIKNLKSATEKVEPADVFMTAASPGVIAIYLENQHYGTTEEYWQAIAEAMRVEYEAIVAAGFILQLDAPDLAMGRHVSKELLSVDELWRCAWSCSIMPAGIFPRSCLFPSWRRCPCRCPYVRPNEPSRQSAVAHRGCASTIFSAIARCSFTSGNVRAAKLLRAGFCPDAISRSKTEIIH
jgi:5-methyltetrahydropteroyltriglutamate--homocysteine methyltransferase